VSRAGRGFRSEDVSESLRAGLLRAARRVEGEGLPAPPVRGKLLRPLVAWAVALPGLRTRALDEGFWMGALAVQMVHEASLLHDDILDGASTRRGHATVAAREGVAHALVAGDHLLTASYRLALRSGSCAFQRIFVEGVERTVAGEVAQGRSAGRRLGMDEYLEILDGKSGALFGCAAALGALHRPAEPEAGESAFPCASGDLEEAAGFGRRLGRLYQMVDDVLDYCSSSRRGKPPLQDFRQGKWTLPLAFVGDDVEEPFALEPPEIQALLFGGRGRSTAASPMDRALERLRAEAAALVAEHGKLAPGDAVIPAVVYGWAGRVESALAAETRTLRGPPAGLTARAAAAPVLGPRSEDGPSGCGKPGGSDAVREEVAADARAVGGPDGWMDTFSRHARSFRFAATLFPGDFRERVAGVYAFCRFTDDLADGDPERPVAERRSRLDAWRELVDQAWDGAATGVPLLDVVVPDSREAGVPRAVLDGLLDGVAMDLESEVRFDSLEQVRLYSHRVASVVGEWIVRLLGITDDWVIERAWSLGQAMQLTNILRDVGEDWRAGRVYLPADRMAAHGVTEEEIGRMSAEGSEPTSGYVALIEELLAVAEADYERASEGLPALPPPVRRAVAVASRVYRGIHREIRRNDYDNLNRRAHTSLGRKLVLAVEALT